MSDLSRAWRITLRTSHIGAGALVIAGALDAEVHQQAGVLLLATGLGIVYADVRKLGWHWFRYIQGQAALTKLALLAIGVARPDWLLACCWAALIIGSVVSHAPGKLRQYAFIGPKGPCATRDHRDREYTTTPSASPTGGPSTSDKAASPGPETRSV